MDQKKFIILCSSVVGVVVVIVVAFLVINMFLPHYVTYEEAEQKIAEAARKYYQKHPEQLPTEDGKSSLSYGTLVSGEYIKPLNEILKDGANCMVDVIVLKSGETYTYYTYLNCGVNYVTKELYRQVLDDHPVVTTGSGLYQDENGNYFFRGKVKDNYVAFGKTKVEGEIVPALWQIISIENNMIKMRATISLGRNYAWDKRYNDSQDKTIGYNDFETSEMKDLLKQLEEGNELVGLEEQSKLVAKELCIGKRKLTDKTKTGATECKTLTQDKYIYGLITPYEYLRASIDENCAGVDDGNCSNFNYLAVSEEENWTLIGNKSNNYDVYYFSGKKFYVEKPKARKDLYLTVNLNEFALYKEGKGTTEEPYVLR